MIEKWHQALPTKFTDIKTTEYIIMPNHFHGIILNVGADPRVRPVEANEHTKGEHMGSPLHRVVQWFKTMTTNEYIRGVKSCNWQPFHDKLWQRNYYEHIIRNDDDYRRIAEYIQTNPLNWRNDQLWTNP